MKVKPLVVILFSVFALTLIPRPVLGGHEDPLKFVSGLVNRYLIIVKIKHNSNLRDQKLRSLIEISFDLPAMTEVMLLGEDVQLEERQTFAKLFTLLLLKRYGNFIKPPETLVITFLRAEISDDLLKATIYTVVKLPTENLDLAYKLHHVDGKWKIYDIFADGVSLVHNYRVQIFRLRRDFTKFSDFLIALENLISIMGKN